MKRIRTTLDFFKIGICLLILLVLSNPVKADTYDWIGKNSTDVTDAGNWARVGGVPGIGLGFCPPAPGLNDDVRIGFAPNYTPTIINLLGICVNLTISNITLTRFPVVTANTTWKSLTLGYNGVTATSYTLRNTAGAQQTFGTKYTMPLTVTGTNVTLTVTGNISQIHNPSLGGRPDNFFNAIISGTGNVVCQGNVLVGDAATQPSTSVADVTQLSIQVNQFTVNGNITLNSNGRTGGTSEVCFPSFSVEKGTTTLLGQMSLVKNFSPPNGGFAALNPGVFGFLGCGQVTADNTTSSPNTFELRNKTPIITPLIDNFYVYFTFGGNNGTTLYSDNNAENQTIYTANEPSTTSTATYINTTNPSYYNLTFSGASTKLVDKNSTIGPALPQGLTVGGNWTTGGGAVDLNTNAPTVTVTGNWINSTTVNQDAGDITVKGSLTNNSPGVLSLGLAKLSIGGNYTNNSGGTYTQSTGTTFFNGTAAQTLQDNSTTGTVFNKVTFNGTSTSTMIAGTGNFIVSNTGILSMVSPAKLVAGTSSAAYLTLRSNATSSATVAAISGSSTITGNVNVERFLTGGVRGYRLMSSPVNTGANIFNVNYIAAKAFITGPGDASNGFNVSTNHNPTLYFYQENVPTSNTSFTSGTFKGLEKLTNGSNTVNITGVTGTTLPVANGFMFYFIGDNITNLVAKGSVTGLISPESVTVVSSGALNQGPISFTPWAYAGSSSTLSKHTPGTGYYLLGNPYASSLDLNNTNLKSGGTGINFSNTVAVQPRFLVYNPVNKGYSYWDPTISNSDGNGASQFLGSGQGFFITILSTGSTTVAFTEVAKVNANQQPAILLMSIPNKLRTNNLGSAAQSVSTINNSEGQTQNTPLANIKLRLASDSVRSDNCAIYFGDEWKTTYDPQEDGIDLDGMGPSVYLSSYSTDSVRLALNKYPVITDLKTKVPLYVSATTTGTYAFSKVEISGLADYYTVFLHDKLLNDSLDITHNNTYNFNLDRGRPETYGSKRFELVINKEPSKYHLLNFTGKKVPEGITLNWKAEHAENYTYFTLEKQDNEGDFKPIYQLKSNGGINYDFIDRVPSTGNNIYRLKQIDRDGKIAYTQVNVVYSLQSLNGKIVKVYPNPADTKIQMSIALESSTASYTLNIISTTGTVMVKKKVTGSDWEENISGFTPGIYIIDLRDESTNRLIGQGKFLKK